MRLRDKFRLLAVSLLLALMAPFAVAASAAPSAEAEALSLAVFEPDLDEALQGGAIPAAPERVPTCFERHDLCKPSSVAPVPDASLVVHAMAGGRLVKAPALPEAPMRDVAPHAAASLSILFRNFRE